MHLQKWKRKYFVVWNCAKMQISVSQKIAQISAGVTRFVSHLRFEIFLCFLCFRCNLKVLGRYMSLHPGAVGWRACRNTSQAFISTKWSSLPLNLTLARRWQNTRYQKCLSVAFVLVKLIVQSIDAGSIFCKTCNTVFGWILHANNSHSFTNIGYS